MPRPAIRRGVAALRKEVAEQVTSRVDDPDEADWLQRRDEKFRALIKAAGVGDTSLTMEDLARVCRDALAWDSLSFLDVLGVDNDGDIRAEPTRKGWRQLNLLNDKPFRFPLDNWDT